MAFPVGSRTTGELITASIWNADLKDNLNALRSGAIALASQAALDMIWASTTSQFSRTAVGAALAYWRVNGAATGFEWATFPTQSLASYAVAVANVLNTAARTVFLSFTIPANSMSDGDAILLRGWSLAKNNSGSPVTAVYDFSLGGVPVNFGGGTWNDDATEYSNTNGFWLTRKATAIGFLNGNTLGGIFSTQNGTADGINITPTNFTTPIAVTVGLTFSAANAMTYHKPQAFAAFHFKR